jgi:hypothetical protein
MGFYNLAAVSENVEIEKIPGHHKNTPHNAQGDTFQPHTAFL